MAESIAAQSAVVNGVHGSPKAGLKILIVGAGIGGLTAAIALRQQGHDIQIFEQSRFASELGAAVHLAPNANGILRRLGIFAETFGANPMEKLTEFTASGERTRCMDLEEPNRMWQHPWLLAHRVHLHDALKKAATSPLGKGKPAQLNTSSPVVDVDVDSATIFLKDGRQISGDLVVGADGVHSITRSKIKEGIKPFGSGKSAFRFLITRKSASEDPITSHFAANPGELIIWYGSDRRVVMYPTSDNTLLNFVCIHPDAESEASGEGWNMEANAQKLVEVFQSFDPAMVTLIKKADPETLKVWKLLDMPILPTWINQRLALLGDAAHPFLPHQGQGAGCAIEDAASLAVVLPADISAEDVPARLKLYESIRFERANKIQEYSRLAGRDIKDGVQINMIEYTNYNFGHDEWDNSTQRLREWNWSRVPQTYWRMPVAFGPMPGPRQTHYSLPRHSEHSTYTTASIRFKTSRTVLQNLFPPGPKRDRYRFKNPGTVAYASFSQTTLGKMEWLGGSGYRHIGLYIHGVDYVKDDGQTITGAYMPILFESLTDPIVSGREELGMPKLYTSIDIYRREKGYRVNTGWEGAIWGNFTWEGLEEVDPKGDAGKVSGGDDDDGVLVYRYIPRVGKSGKGRAEAEYPVFVPFDGDTPLPKTQRMWKAKKAGFKIDKLDWEALPTLHHIVERLQEIPVYEVVAAKVVEGVGVPDVRQAHRIE